MREFDLGAVTAYAIAVKHGFKGTEAEWAEYMQANAVVAKEAETNAKQYAENAKASETNVGKSATDAKAAATNAATSAQNAAKSAQRAEEAANKAGGIKTVNGKKPDESGNVEIDSVASWNDLTDKPFGEETVEILPECSPDYDEDNGAFHIEGVGARLVPNQTYTVNWNGVEYTCVAIDLADGVVIGLGDVGLLSGEPTMSEPFLIVDDDGDLVAVAADGSTELTLSIKQTTTTHLPTKYLPDGVPYCIDGGMVEVLAECQPSYDEAEGGFFIENAPALEIGKTYTVNWNGTEYTATAFDASETLGVASVMLADDSLDFDTGEGVFLIVYEVDTAVLMCVDMSGSTELTLSIHAGGTDIRKLDNRCLDLEWLPTVGLDTLIEKTEIAHTDFMQSLTYTDFPTGTKLVVVMDGAPYKVTVKQAGSGLDAVWYFGNGKLASTGLEGTADPFCASLYSTGATWRFADGGTHTIEICEETPNKLPEEFLPESVDGVIIRSSTEGSTKKFKLTVDDSGTITATEVTA